MSLRWILVTLGSGIALVIAGLLTCYTNASALDRQPPPVVFGEMQAWAAMPPLVLRGNRREF